MLSRRGGSASIGIVIERAASRPANPPAEIAGLWLVAIALAALFTAFQIQSSLHSGQLSLPVTYDDVGYFNDALARLETLYRDGGRAFLSTFWANPPHAPLQTLLTLGAFGLFGPQHWAGAAMNAVPLALLLRLMLGYACRALPLSTSAVLAAAFLGFPLLGLLVLECRPDMLCALLTAAGALIVAADPRWRDGDRQTLAISTALFVGALLAKPTLAPVTAVVFGTAALSAILQAQDRKRAMRLALICGGIAALLALPYYLAVLPRLYAYITVNAFGSNASIWRANLPWSEHAAYYLTGYGGKAAIGKPWLVLCGSLLLVASFPLRRAALAVLPVVLVAFASVTVPSMKSPFLGVIVGAFLLGVAVILTVSLLARLPQRVALAGAVVLLAFSAAAWRPAFLRLRGFDVPITQAEHFKRIYTQTADALVAIPDLANRRLYFPVITPYLNQENIEFELRRRELPVPIQMPAIYHDADIASHRKAIAQADVAVLFSDDSTLPGSWPASEAIRKEINAAAAERFEPVAKIDGGPYPGQVMVFMRKK